MLSNLAAAAGRRFRALPAASSFAKQQQWAAGIRQFHVTLGTKQAEEADGQADDDDDAEGGPKGPVRVGRPFLDPRAPRRQESIRNDPRHAKWGGMIDILEHNAYCDGQREEDPDGFFFDDTRAEYDSDCDGDPFSNGYLTEDEMEFPEEYQPAPYLPNRIVEQIWFLYSMRGYTVQQLSNRYRVTTEKVSAILALKKTEPEMIAAGMYSNVLEQYLLQIYGGDGPWAKEASRTENFGPDFDIGVNYNIMQDDQMPDDCYPVIRRGGNILRRGHVLPRIAQPPVSERLHKSKYAFMDVSGDRKNHRYGKKLKLRMSDYDGTIRPATNKDLLYRSYEGRYWTMELEKGKNGMPYKDEDAIAPAHGDKGYRIPP